VLPLYKSVARPSLQARPHVGLWYDKLADRWQTLGGGTGAELPEFDKPGWIRQFAGKELWAPERLQEMTERQARLASALGGIVLRLRNTGRFVTGLGRDHPVENGFAWHPTLGTPYLPGSGLKGVLRAWRRLDHNAGSHQKAADRLMGKHESAGRVILLDLLPTAPPVLVAEIMTPHYGPYYGAGPDNAPPPGDWYDPTPIPFLVVESGQSWQCAIVPAPGARAPAEAEWRSLERELLDALAWLGAGAKTASGYGLFELDEAATRLCRQGLEEAAEDAKRHRQRERATAGMTPMAAEFYHGREDGGWTVNRDAFVREGLIEGWLDRLGTDPDPDVLRMLTELIDTHFPGLLTDPERTQGKKGKPVFKERQRTIARRLRHLRGQ